MMCVIENASKRLLCSSSGAMQMVYDNFFDLYKRILDKHREGGGKDVIRWITTIDKNNEDLVKAFLNVGVQIRHLRNLPPMNFAVNSNTDRTEYSNLHRDWSIAKRRYRPYHKGFETIVVCHLLHTLVLISFCILCNTFRLPRTYVSLGYECAKALTQLLIQEKINNAVD